jgi:hypothetical protein
MVTNSENGMKKQTAKQWQGKELSYTNVLDIEAAADLILDFVRPTIGILKHTNPCGVGQDDDDLREAWRKAFETDRQAPFGGVIVCNRPLTEGVARIISEIFTDVIIAPDYELLLFRDEITGARVQEFSKGRTIGLIVGAVLAAGGAFAAVSLLAPEDQGLGGN